MMRRAFNATSMLIHVNWMVRRATKTKEGAIAYHEWVIRELRQKDCRFQVKIHSSHMEGGC